MLQVTNTSKFDLDDSEYKMVLVVRNDLKMGKGKVAAQVMKKMPKSLHHKVKVTLSLSSSVLMLQLVPTNR